MTVSSQNMESNNAVNEMACCRGWVSGLTALWLMGSGALFAQELTQEPEREEDDEPNQHAILEPLGTESEEERSRWLLEGAELVLKPRTYYLHRDYDTANTLSLIHI